MKGELDLLYRTIEPLSLLPQTHLALLHLKLLAAKTTESFLSSDKPAIDAATQAIELLRSEKLPPASSPLEHHQIALIAAVLAFALPVVDERQSVVEALEELKNVVEKRLAPAWREKVAAFINAKIEGAAKTEGNEGGRGGLEHLANAAVGSGGEKEEKEGEGMDWSAVLGKGYFSLYE